MLRISAIKVKCPSCGEDIPYDIDYIKLRFELGNQRVTSFCPRCLMEHEVTLDGKVKPTGRRYNPYAAKT